MRRGRPKRRKEEEEAMGCRVGKPQRSKTKMRMWHRPPTPSPRVLEGGGGFNLGLLGRGGLLGGEEVVVLGG